MVVGSRRSCEQCGRGVQLGKEVRRAIGCSRCCQIRCRPQGVVHLRGPLVAVCRPEDSSIQMSKEAILGISSSGHISRIIIKPVSSAVVALICVDADAAYAIAAVFLNLVGSGCVYNRENVCDVRRRHANANTSRRDGRQAGTQMQG